MSTSDPQVIETRVEVIDGQRVTVRVFEPGIALGAQFQPGHCMRSRTLQTRILEPAEIQALAPERVTAVRDRLRVKGRRRVSLRISFRGTPDAR